MSFVRHKFPVFILEILDLVFIAFSCGLAAAFLVHTQRQMSLTAFLSLRARVADVLIFSAALVAHHLVLRAFNAYRSHRLSTMRAESFDLLIASALSLLLFACLGKVFAIQMFTGSFLFTMGAADALLLVLSRLVLRTLQHQLRMHDRNLRYILIFGTNPRAVAFARDIARRPERGYRLVGFVDDEWHGIGEFRATGFETVTNFAGLAEFLRNHIIDEVAVYLPFGSFSRHWNDITDLCAHHGIALRVNADMFGLHPSRWLAEDVDGRHSIATRTGAGEGWPITAKRLLDILISSFCLLALLPLLITVAIAVKLTSPGPILFLQERVGLNKRRFKIFKFRTMVPNAEQLMRDLEQHNEVSGPVFKIKNDPRITPIGKFLRRSSIDELPQLINVFKGDMSLVGPRPLPVRDYEGFNEDWQRRRFSVRPGITCLWQVNGRSAISFDQWMRLDLKYMDEWSLWLDLKILARTVPAVVRGSGAA